MNSLETRHFINGQFVHSSSNNTFEIRNPANGDVVANVPIADEADINAAVASAKAAQPAWEALSAVERASYIYKLASLFKDPEHAQNLAYLDAVCMGRNMKENFSRVTRVAETLGYFAGLSQSANGTSSLNTAEHLNLTLKQPYGVVAGIMTWNIPVNLAALKIGPAIGAGNAIIIKSSEKAPLSLLYFAKLVQEAGIPPGIVNFVSGDGSAGALLSSHMEIRKISFTGSGKAGRLIAKAAALSNLKKVSLELGGKSPIIVFPDANIENAALAAMRSITHNAGQICTAASRVYVHESVADVFKEKFKTAMLNVKHGDPLNSDATSMGPQADSIQGKIVMEYLGIGNKDGKILCGGNRVGSQGYFIEPTIYVDVPEESRINKEEVFGPVVVLHTFKDENDVIRRANDSDYGLRADIYTKDIDRALRVVRSLESGAVGVNCASFALPLDMPFGGYKASGQGRELGPGAVEDWLETKTVTIKLS